MAGIDQLMDPLARPISALSQADPYRGAFGEFGSPMVGRVTGYDYELDELGVLQLDENRNPKPTGLLEIELLDRPGTRTKVPYVLPMAGNTMFMGGLPELETLCIVEFRQQNNPVVIGFLPPGLHNLKNVRGQIQVPLPGEILIQASTSSTDNNGNANFFKGATVKLDRYGRYVVTLGGVGKDKDGNDTLEKRYELIVGHMLSHEYRVDNVWLTEPRTGLPVFLRESVLDGQVERRVDAEGNAVNRFNKKLDEFVGGTHTEKKVGKWTVIANQGILIQDDAGNRIELSPEGKVTIKTTGAMDLLANGSQVVAAGGNQDMQVALRRAATVGEDDLLSVAGSLKQEVAKDHELNVATGSSMEDVILGMKKIHATLGIEFETEAIMKLTALVQAVLDAKIIQIGSGSAVEPVVLGNQLLLALTELIAIFPTAFALGAPAGPPVVASTAGALAFSQWLLKWVTVPVTNVVSLKVFTEKGP